MTVSDPILARYPGRCDECNEPIFVDDSIIEVDGDWVHEECADEEPES